MSSHSYLYRDPDFFDEPMTMTISTWYDGTVPPPEPGKRYDIKFNNVAFYNAEVRSVNIHSFTDDGGEIEFCFAYDKAVANEEHFGEVKWYDASDNSVTLTTTATYSSSVVSGGADGFNYTINMPTTYEGEFVGEDEVKDMKNLLRKVYVVRREEGGYAFAEFGPYVSKDPEKLVQHVLLKFGSKDAIFADVDLEAGDDKLTFVVQTLSDTVIPELDD